MCLTVILENRPMRIQVIDCERCGAPLDVPKKRRYVTCSFCQTQLRVYREPSLAYTRALQAVSRRLDNIQHENELERIEREWDMEQAEHPEEIRTGEQTKQTELTNTAAFSGALILMIGIAVFEDPLAAVFSPFVIWWIVVSVRGYSQVATYERAKAAYEENRQALIRSGEDDE